jgi:glycosyltransferase involved in cell wall biosynthesis
MKIVLVHFAGFWDYTIGLANGLAGLAEVRIIFGKPVAPQKLVLLDRRIQYEIFDKPDRDSHPRNLTVIWNILQRIKHFRPDVLHIQESLTPCFELGLLAYGAVAELPPIVATVHDANRHPGDLSIRLHDQTRHITMNKARAVIVHAHQVKRDLIARFQLSENMVHVLPHGELGTLFRSLSSQPVPVREQASVLFFGRLVRYKGLDYLVEAMPLVRQSIPEAKLIIAGGTDTLREYAHKVGPPCEVYPGHVGDDHVAELFQRASVLVLPYIEASQSGVASIGLALGTPVIASAVGGLRELIRDGKDGLLVPPGDSKALAKAISRLLSDPGLCSEIRENIRAKCSTELAWDNIAKRTFTLYHEVLGYDTGETKCA